MSQQPVVHPSSSPSQGDVQNMNTIVPPTHSPTYLHCNHLAPGPPNTGKIPPIRPNTDLHCNHLALCPSGLPKASSPLIREAWDSFLADYPDCEFVSGLLNIIDVGASIGHSGPPISQLCKNLRSALDHPDVISKEVDSLQLEGHTHGPFEEPPLPYFRCSPLGTSTRKCDPK